MKIKDILKVKGSQIWTIKTAQTIQGAVKMLGERNVGALLVVDDKGRVAGILSERDVVRALRSGPEFLSQPVSKLMTAKVISCSPEDEIGPVMTTMTEKRIRHLPVLEHGELCGLVSIGDIVKALLEDSAHQIRYLKEYMFGPQL